MKYMLYFVRLSSKSTAVHFSGYSVITFLSL